MEASRASTAWLGRFYEAIDALRFDEVADQLHEDCRCVYPGGHVQVGRQRIVRTLHRSIEALAQIRHVVRNAWE